MSRPSRPWQRRGSGGGRGCVGPRWTGGTGGTGGTAVLALAAACLVLGIACRRGGDRDSPRQAAGSARVPLASVSARLPSPRSRVSPLMPNSAEPGTNGPRPGDPELLLPRQAEAPMPLVVYLHGFASGAKRFAAALGIAAHVQEHGYAAFVPHGDVDYAGRSFWEAGPACCNFDGSPSPVSRGLRDRVQALAARPRIDAERVFLVGFSNGGFLAHRAACHWGELLAAVASIAGAGLPPGEACPKPPQSVNFLQVHGTRDAVVKPAGGFLFADTRRPYPSVEASLAPWLALNGCASKPQWQTRLDLDPRMRGSETRVGVYPGCAAGGVQIWSIEGGDHVSGLSHRTLEAVFRFFQAVR